MNAKLLFTALLLSASLLPLPHSLRADILISEPQQTAATPNLQQLATDAMGEDASKSALAIARLRAAGYPGLDACLKLYAESGFGSINRNTPQPNHALDQIAMQKDAIYSRLYWYTDLDAAKAQAARENKPILSLHLLGKLNENLSCANSRFFRTTLYPNKEIAAYLRNNFILHWQSERPVPVVTIDFGDGRKITRTLTGNSIHYILDPQGRLVDAIPGLYGPAAFLRTLQSAETEAKTLAPLDDAAYTTALAKFHADQTAAIQKNFATDLKQLHLPESNLNFSTLTDLEWKQISLLHYDDATLDAAAIAAMKNKIPAGVAMQLTVTKMASEDPIMRLVQNVEGSIRIDSVKNEYIFHEQISRYLSQPLGLRHPHPPEVADINTYVYTYLFKTPPSDPWLGLAQPDIYTAIDNDGLSEVAAR